MFVCSNICFCLSKGDNTAVDLKMKHLLKKFTGKVISVE